MAIISPKNETATSLRLYFLVGGILILIYELTNEFTTAPELTVSTLGIPSMLVIVASLVLIYLAITLKKLLNPAKIKTVHILIFFALALSLLAGLLTKELDYISIGVQALYFWYLYAATKRLAHS